MGLTPKCMEHNACAEAILYLRANYGGGIYNSLTSTAYMLGTPTLTLWEPAVTIYGEINGDPKEWDIPGYENPWLITVPGGSGSGRGRSGSPSLGQLLKQTACSALPTGRVVSVQGGLGGLGANQGSIDFVMNYDTGEVSQFWTWTFQVGWNGVASGSASTGLIWGSLGPGNINYKGPFVGIAGSGTVPPGPISAGGSAVSSGGVNVVQVSGGVSLLGRYALGVVRSVTSDPTALPQFTGFQAGDFEAFLVRQAVCHP
jgi:hypothetical protein